MPIELYFVDRDRRPEGSIRNGLREALIDRGLMPLDEGEDPCRPSNQGRVYRLVVEEVKPKDQS